MLGQLMNDIRTGVLAASGLTVDRSFVAGGPDWSVEGCSQLVVWLAAPRNEYQGPPGNRPQQGIGIPAVACAAAPVYDIGVAYYAACYPASDTADPVKPDLISDWALPFLDAVEAVNLALLGLTLPEFGQMVVGQAVPGSPSPSGGVAGYRWPCSLFPIVTGVEFGA